MWYIISDKYKKYIYDVSWIYIKKKYFISNDTTLSVLKSNKQEICVQK